MKGAYSFETSVSVAYPGIFFGGGGVQLCSVGGSTNSVEDRGQREPGFGAVAP
jgi:hypothetical protein